MNKDQMADEPDWNHPKLQALISRNARLSLQLGIIEDLIDDPAHEYDTDGDYASAVTDKVHAFVKAHRTAPTPTQGADAQPVAIYQLPSASQIYAAIEGVAATRTSPENICDVLAIINRLRIAASAPCQYAKDVGMWPEHRCKSGHCEYASRDATPADDARPVAIQRYTVFETQDGRGSHIVEEPCSTGKWVKFADLATRDALCKELRLATGCAETSKHTPEFEAFCDEQGFDYTSAIPEDQNEVRAAWITWQRFAPTQGADARPVEHCVCPACKDGLIHASDCAVHNAPALTVGPCSCGAASSKPDPGVHMPWRK